jgi:hypothetical protein
LRADVADLRSGAKALAGMTTAADLSILQDLARDERLTLRYRGIHDNRLRSHTDHRLIGYNSDWPDMAVQMTHAESRWPLVLAQALHRSNLGAYQRTLELPVRTTRSLDHAGVLVSWLLA